MEVSESTRRGLLIGLVVYSALLGVALLAPTSGTQSTMASWVSDLGTWVGFSEETANQGRAEFLCNVAILAPVSAIGSLLWTRTTWRDWTAYAFVIACVVELVQELVLPGRTASYVDIVANTLGGLVGAAVVDLTLRRTAAGTPPTPPARPAPRPDRRS
jgi:glycopeptide antibiotics resistance protein